jgi:hypothetical protein
MGLKEKNIARKIKNQAKIQRERNTSGVATIGGIAKGMDMEAVEAW